VVNVWESLSLRIGYAKAVLVGVPALEVQDRLVHARFDCHGDAAFPRRDARKTGGVTTGLSDGLADPVACLLTGARTVRGHRDAAMRTPHERK
jgi:hypothetical protein